MLRSKLAFTLPLLILHFLIPLAHAQGPTFGIDEIVEAIKLEIMGAQAIESGSPRIQIDGFDLSLAVVAASTSQGSIEFRVPGIDAENESGFLRDAIHRINISMSLSQKKITTAIASNLGILSAIQNVKSTLRNAFNAPPSIKVNKSDISIEFAIVKTDKQKYVFYIITSDKANYKAFATHVLVIHMSIDKKNQAEESQQNTIVPERPWFEPRMLF